MATAAKYLSMPDGRQFEFYGKTWYGDCPTAANTASKTASIIGFTSADLVPGTRIVVRFQNGQNSSSMVTLNASGTGDKTVYSRCGASAIPARQYEWDAGAIIGFIYYNDYWIIEDGGHASETYWGKTKLSNTISSDQTTALTPYAVQQAGYLTLADLPIYNGGVS